VALGAALYAFFNVLQSLWEIGAKQQSRQVTGHEGERVHCTALG
jgi:hypothetical protein